MTKDWRIPSPADPPRSYTRPGVACLLAAMALAGCSGSEPVADRPLRNGYTPDAVPKLEPISRYGNPPFYVVGGERYDVLPSSEGFVERGIASWYGPDFHGRRASSGETYDMYGMTAAHPVLPLPTYVQVTNLGNGRRAIVRVNDRGPFHSNRVIDLSYAAAHKLGIVQDGTGLVEVRALNPGRPPIAPTDKVILSASPNLFVQVGAFSEFQNAERLRAHLASLNVSGIHIQPSADIGDPFYRVRIGPMASVAAADFMTKRLEALGWRDYRVVVD